MRLSPRGVLVAFEGIDGAGKSTQIERLEGSLTALGLPVVRSREPTNGPWGQLLRSSALTGRLPPEEELAAFLADRRQHVDEVLAPALAAGAVMLVDRYYFSTAAYQGLRGLDPAEILRKNEEFAPVPDLLVIFEVPIDEALRRIGSRNGAGDLFEKREDLARCAAIFASFSGPYILRVDGAAPPDAIAAKIQEAIHALPEVAAALRGAH